jgi:hypothetical protein
LDLRDLYPLPTWTECPLSTGDSSGAGWPSLAAAKEFEQRYHGDAVPRGCELQEDVQDGAGDKMRRMGDRPRFSHS